MKTLIFLLLLSCTTPTETAETITYTIEVESNKTVEFNVIKDGIHTLYITNELNISGEITGSLRLFGKSDLEFSLKIWVYGELRYDQVKKEHKQELLRLR